MSKRHIRMWGRPGVQIPDRLTYYNPDPIVSDDRPFIWDFDMEDGLKNVSDIPKAWRDLFGIIREALPGTVMAGGCLRDRDIGVKVNDIDLFVPMASGEEKDLTAVKTILAQLGAERVEILGDKMYPQGVDNQIIGVVEAKFVSCPLVFQLVIGDWGSSIPDLFSRFDFSICKIAYDGRQIHRDPDYRIDRKSKLFRITSRRSRRAFEQSVQRYAKLLPKFPGWKFSLGHIHVEHGGHSSGVVSDGGYDLKRPFG